MPVRLPSFDMTSEASRIPPTADAAASGAPHGALPQGASPRRTLVAVLLAALVAATISAATLSMAFAWIVKPGDPTLRVTAVLADAVTLTHDAIGDGDTVFPSPAVATWVAAGALQRGYTASWRVGEAGDVDTHELSRYLTPSMERRTLESVAEQVANPIPEAEKLGPVHVGSPRLVYLSDHGDEAIVMIAFCKQQRVPGAGVFEPMHVVEGVASLVSTVDDPAHLRVTGLEPWVGEPVC